MYVYMYIYTIIYILSWLAHFVIAKDQTTQVPIQGCPSRMKLINIGVYILWFYQFRSWTGSCERQCRFHEGN